MILRLTVPGPVPRKNRRHGLTVRNGKPRAFTSKAYATWIRLLRTAAADWPRIASGAWLCRIEIFHSKMRKLDVKVPFIDVDAPISCVFDGMQKAELLDDDVRIGGVFGVNHTDTATPRLVLEMRRLLVEGEEWSLAF